LQVLPKIIDVFSFCVVQASAAKMRIALFWVIRQQVVVISYRRFGTTYRSHLQKSRIHRESPAHPTNQPVSQSTKDLRAETRAKAQVDVSRSV